MRTNQVLVAIVAALTAAGCARPDPRICETPPTRQESQQGVDSARKFTRENPDAAKTLHSEAVALEAFLGDCVHRWAYRLAGSAEPARIAAEAAVNLCEDAIFPAAYARDQADEASYGDRRASAFDEILRTMTGEMQRKALGHVVQFRAGHCAVPE